MLGVRGMDASDRADYPAALDLLTRSVGLADRCGDARQQAWSASVLARAHLLRGEHDAALAAVTRSLALVEDQRWLAFHPFARALKAELDLLAGDDAAVETVETDLAQAWALSCQLGDPCWEGLTARGMALLYARRDEPDRAARWVEEALRRCSAVSDRYQWVSAHVLDTAVRVALDRGDTTAARHAADALAALAARCGLRELVVRAELHRARLGDPGALVLARLLGAGIDNPALAADLAREAAGPGATLRPGRSTSRAGTPSP